MDIKTIVEDKSVQIGVGVIVGFGLGYFLGRHIYRNQTIVVPAEEPSDIEPIVEDEITDEEYATMARQYNRVSSFDDIRVEDGKVVLNTEPTDDIVIDNEVSEEILLVEDSVVESDETEPDEESDSSADAISEEKSEEVSESEEPPHHNIFANDDTWDYEAEVASRTKTAPYVIHRDEWFTNESGYPQHTFTYYNGDDILVDDNEKFPQPIYRHDKVVGEIKDKFGHGSGDRSVVYVRNDDLGAEYEIILLESLYSVEVQGMDNPNDPRNREPLKKFRDSD